MKVFDHSPPNVRPTLSVYVPNDAPTWMTGIVIIAAIIMGTFMFEDSSTHQSVAPPQSHEITITQPAG